MCSAHAVLSPDACASPCTSAACLGCQLRTRCSCSRLNTRAVSTAHLLLSRLACSAVLQPWQALPFLPSALFTKPSATGYWPSLRPRGDRQAAEDALHMASQAATGLTSARVHTIWCVLLARLKSSRTVQLTERPYSFKAEIVIYVGLVVVCSGSATTVCGVVQWQFTPCRSSCLGLTGFSHPRSYFFSRPWSPTCTLQQR